MATAKDKIAAQVKAMDDSELNDLRSYLNCLPPSADSKAWIDVCKSEQAARRLAKAAERGKALAAKLAL